MLCTQIKQQARGFRSIRPAINPDLLGVVHTTGDVAKATPKIRTASVHDRIRLVRILA
jgi:hypothetical protein